MKRSAAARPSARGTVLTPGLVVALVLVPVLASACAGEPPSQGVRAGGAPPGEASAASAPSRSGQSSEPLESYLAMSPSAQGPARQSGDSKASAQPRAAGEIATGLDAPWGLAFLPGGDALVSERDSGRIVRVPASGGPVTPVGKVPGVAADGEGGLLGLAVSPTFSRDRLVYAYFTSAKDNRVVRMRYDEQPGRLGEPDVIVEGLAKNVIHNGGRLAFGPDGLLYITTGDAARRGSAQDRGSRNGKILRVTPAGRPAPGNPFADSPVYSLGHRNVQGLAWDEQGRLWASEFGQNSFDELNLIEPGRNYGWPEVEGVGGVEGLTDPEVTWTTEEASPSGMAIAGGSVYLAALRGTRLWQVPIAGGHAGRPNAFLQGTYGRLRTVAVAPDGSLWLMTSNTDGRGSPRRGDDRILRLTLS